jgi:hypothetical protein
VKNSALHGLSTNAGLISGNSGVRQGGGSLECCYWLPASERFTNFLDLAFWIDPSRLYKGEFFVSPVEAADTEPTTLHNEPTMPVVNPVKQAFILKDILEQGTCATQADLAEHLGMSRARVTQTLNLLKLAPEILDALLNLPDNQAWLFSERRLRPITQISSPKKQTAVFREICAQLQANGVSSGSWPV